MTTPGKIRLFLVEDDELQAEVMEHYLSLEGFEIRHVDGPIGATNAARSFQPDIVLVDLDLPGFDGHRLIPLLRQGGIKARCFIYSSRDESAIKRVAQEVGANWFSKSTPIEVMAKLLRS